MTFNFNQQQNNAIQNKSLYEVIYARKIIDENGIRELHKLAQTINQIPAEVGDINGGSVNQQIRRSNVAWITPDKCPQEMSTFFQNAFLDVNKNYFEFNITGTEAYQYTVYEENNAGTYNWHTDTMLVGNNDVRKISMSLLLTDPSEFEGGKLLFNNQGNIVVAEEKLGSAVFFPSWMPHCVTPVTKGIRKVLVIWAHGPKFK